MPQSFVHDPDAVLDYTIDWSDWLTGGDTIASVVWTVPTGLSLDDDSNTTAAATAWISGGTAGTRYSVVCHIVTAGGREDDRTLTLVTQER